MGAKPNGLAGKYAVLTFAAHRIGVSSAFFAQPVATHAYLVDVF
jgi:hypothetical protein